MKLYKIVPKENGHLIKLYNKENKTYACFSETKLTLEEVKKQINTKGTELNQKYESLRRDE